MSGSAASRTKPPKKTESYVTKPLDLGADLRMSHDTHTVIGMVSHPWRELRLQPHIQLEYVDDLPFGIHAQTDGERRIWMNPKLLRVEQRCALQHELEHILQGHRGHQPPAVEHQIKLATARKLIAWDELIDARRWARHNYPEMADMLNVTPRVLCDRISHLEGEERHAFDYFE